MGKEAMNLKDIREGQMGQFEGRKGNVVIKL